MRLLATLLSLLAGPAWAAPTGLNLIPTTDLVPLRQLSLGLQNANTQLRGIRAHAGILRTVNAWRALVGTDIEVSDHFVVYADWTSGGRNSVSLGGVLVIDRENSIVAAALRGNHEDRVSGILVQFTHTFSW